MIANYGYKDGSGEFFIRLDTDSCNGCGDCVSACPAGAFEVREEDPNDPFRETPVAVIKDSERKKIKYTCGPCKPGVDRPPLPCLTACKTGAIRHYW
jgi:ferredoxin